MQVSSEEIKGRFVSLFDAKDYPVISHRSNDAQEMFLAMFLVLQFKSEIILSHQTLITNNADYRIFVEKDGSSKSINIFALERTNGSLKLSDPSLLFPNYSDYVWEDKESKVKHLNVCGDLAANWFYESIKMGLFKKSHINLTKQVNVWTQPFYVSCRTANGDIEEGWKNVISNRDFFDTLMIYIKENREHFK